MPLRSPVPQPAFLQWIGGRFLAPLTVDTEGDLHGQRNPATGL